VQIMAKTPKGVPVFVQRGGGGRGGGGAATKIAGGGRRRQREACKNGGCRLYQTTVTPLSTVVGCGVTVVGSSITVVVIAFQ